MLNKIKRRLYFVVAAYFAFWARIVLRRWRLRIVVVTGSTGKTTLLHLLEAQLGDKAVYSHHANGAIGLPFHILGMETNVASRRQWPVRFIMAPLKICRRLPPSKLYIAEADCDRPHEGQFVSKLLKPEATLWVSVYRTHSMNFDRLVKKGAFATHEAAIAYEFGWFPARTGKLVLANGDQQEIVSQLSRVPEGAKTIKVSAKAVAGYELKDSRTIYTIAGQVISLQGLHPRELGNSLQMVNELLDYLGIELDPSYKKLEMPPGRSNIFKGRKQTILIDSTYNTGLGATTAILKLFNDYPAERKWVVLGDILEQGSLEQEEHERLARAVSELDIEHAVLLGPRTARHTYPMLQKLLPDIPIASFENPKEVLDYLNANLKGGEAILFKGGRFLEGVIEQLLMNPDDAAQLVRREGHWVKRRQKWGLPK